MTEVAGTPDEGQVEEAAAAEAPAQPNVEEMVNRLVSERLEEYQGQHQSPESEYDFGTLIQGGTAEDIEPEVPALTEADIQMLEEAGVLDPDPGQYEDETSPELAALYERIDQLEADLSQRSEQETREQLNALAERYPDITSDEVFPTLNQRVQQLAAVHGDHLASDPSVVEALYHSIKFDVAKASETPAKLAATQGTSLESGAGVSDPPEPDLKDEYIKAIRSPGAGSVFV